MPKRGDKAAKPAPKRVRKPRPPANVLGDEARAFIVTSLASYVSPIEVMAQVQERFGVEISKQAVSHYHPDTVGKPDQRWIDLFHAARKRFIDEVADHGVAHRAYRVRSLQRVHDKLLGMVDGVDPTKDSIVDLAKEFRGVLEQAAKEVGGVFTNITKNESQSLIAVVPVTLDEKRNVLAERIAEAMQKALPAPKEGTP